MALSFDAAQMAVMVKESFEPAYYRTFEQSTFFYKFIQSAGITQSYVEKDITWKAYISGNPAAGSYREDGSVGITRNDLGPRFTTARLGWRLQRVPIVVSGLAQAISRSPSAIIDAAAENTTDALKMLQRNMNRQALSDGLGNLNGADPDLNTSGLDLTGIQAMWDDGSAVPIYAGIDRSVNTFWRSFVVANPSGQDRPITEELMHQVLNEMRGVREADIDQLTCSLGVFTQFGLLLGQDRRYNFGGQETPSYRGGFQEAWFNGLQVTAIPLYQKNRMDFWSRALLSFKMLLDFTIEPRDAGDSDSMKMFAKTYCQMQYKNPWHSASLRNLIEQ